MYPLCDRKRSSLVGLRAMSSSSYIASYGSSSRAFHRSISEAAVSALAARERAPRVRAAKVAIASAFIWRSVASLMFSSALGRSHRKSGGESSSALP